MKTGRNYNKDSLSFELIGAFTYHGVGFALRQVTTDYRVDDTIRAGRYDYVILYGLV